jgi:hypothetical protein
MLLKGLVLQSMPQATMISAVAAELRGPRRNKTCKLSEVRDYLKTQVAIEKGNLKIGKAVIEEMARQDARHAEREAARSVEERINTIELTRRQSTLNRDGERTKLHKADKSSRIYALAVSLFGAIDCTDITVHNGPRRNLAVSEESLWPVFRTVNAGIYYMSALVHRLPSVPCGFQVLVMPEGRHVAVSPRVTITSAVGTLVTRGHHVEFRRQECLFLIDGAPHTPVEVVHRTAGGQLTLVLDPVKAKDT